MNANLSPEQIDFYQEQGYIILEDFLTMEEVEHWRKVLDEAILGRGNALLPDRKGLAHEAPDKGPEDRDNSYYGQVFQQRVNLWQDNPAVKELILDPRIGKLATELEGVDGMRVWHDQALYKAPWSNPTSWHLDNVYWSFSSAHATSIWIALDDVGPENGCLFFLPGTHKKQDFSVVPIGPSMPEVFETHPDFKGIEPAVGRMKAGSCSFHNGLTVHGATPNMTPRWRRAMTCGFMPLGSTFNGKPNILSQEQIAKLSIGDLLDDDEQNPIVYARTEEFAGV